MSKPKFDPSKPFETVSPSKPKFDPGRPYQAARGEGSFDLGGQPAQPSAPVARSNEKYESSAAQPPSVAAPMSFGERLRKAASTATQGLTGNLAHRFAPEAMAAMDEFREMFNATSPSSFKDRVADYREQWAADVDPAVAAIYGVPLSVATGNVAPAMNTLPGVASTSALFAASEADRQGKNIVDNAGTVAGQAAMMTAAPYVLKGIGWGAGRALEMGAPVGRTLRDLLRGGYVRPTPEAQRMMGEGVPLTLGQMDPSSPLGRFEEIAANNALGADLARTRAATGPAVRDVILSKAAAPGARPPTAGAPVAAQLDELRSGFTQLYDDALEGIRIEPEQYIGRGRWRGFFTDPSVKGAAKVKGAFERAAEVPDASESVKARALSWFRDAATRNNLAPRKSGEALGTVEARAVQELRRDVRKKVRAYAGKEGDEAPQFEEIYKRAEDFLTELLEGQLPPKNVAKLQAADANYRNLLAVEDAATGKIAHRSEGDFTADQLIDAIWRRGGVSPDLDRAARDARAVLNPTYPKTGALPGAANVLLEGKYAGPLFAKMANASPALRSHAVGYTPAPWWLRAPVAAGEFGANLSSLLEPATASPSTSSAALRLMDLLRDPVTP